jgi:hypothetical protein
MIRIDPSEWNYFEVILGEQNQKPHFDIDIKIKHDKETNEMIPIILAPDYDSPYRNSECQLINGYLQNHPDDLEAHTEIGRIQDIIIQEIIDIIIDGILKFIPDLNFAEDLLIYTSHSSTTRSVHLIVDNYLHRNNKEAKEFYNKIMEGVPKEYADKDYIDHSVYKSIQQFRIFNNTKPKADRYKVLNPHFCYRGNYYSHNAKEIGNPFMNAFQESLISYTCYCKLLPMTDEILVPNLVKKHQVNYSNYDGELEIEDIETAIEFLENYLNPHEERKVTIFTYREHKGTLIALDRDKHITFNCLICKRSHDNDNPYLHLKDININNYYYGNTKMDYGFDVYYRCHRDNTGQKIHLGIIKKAKKNSDDNDNNNNNEDRQIPDQNMQAHNAIMDLINRTPGIKSFDSHGNEYQSDNNSNNHDNNQWTARSQDPLTSRSGLDPTAIQNFIQNDNYSVVHQAEINNRTKMLIHHEIFKEYNKNSTPTYVSNNNVSIDFLNKINTYQQSSIDEHHTDASSIDYTEPNVKLKPSGTSKTNSKSKFRSTSKTNRQTVNHGVHMPIDTQIIDRFFDDIEFVSSIRPTLDNKLTKSAPLASIDSSNIKAGIQPKADKADPTIILFPWEVVSSTSSSHFDRSKGKEKASY